MNTQEAIDRLEKEGYDVTYIKHKVYHNVTEEEYELLDALNYLDEHTNTLYIIEDEVPKSYKKKHERKIELLKELLEL